jgi:hypothetical protein
VIVARDLGGRNGTLCEGRPLVDAPVGERLELVLGGHVRVVLRAGSFVGGPLAIEVAGARYVAALAPTAPLGIQGWHLALGPDGWAELVTAGASPTFRAFRGNAELEQRITLLEGDAFATARGAAPAIAFGRPC